MPNQVPESVKSQRSMVLQEIEERASKAFREDYIGKNVEVLLEEQKEIKGTQYIIGHTKEYVKAAAAVTGVNGSILENEIVQGTVTGFLEADILLLQI